MAELEQEEMSFWDHLEALRWTLFRSFLALFIFAIGSFAFMRGSDGIFDRVVLAPCYSDFIFYRWLCDLNQWLVNVSPWFDVLPDFCNDNFHVDVFNIRLASQFFTHMTTSFWLALVLTFPYLMWEIWKFISPALYENEKKYSVQVVSVVYSLFIIGILMSYYVLFPVSFRFLGTYSVAESVRSTITLDSYISTFVTLSLLMGVVFQLPVIAFFLAKMEIVNSRMLSTYRRHAFFGDIDYIRRNNPAGHSDVGTGRDTALFIV